MTINTDYKQKTWNEMYEMDGSYGSYFMEVILILLQMTIIDIYIHACTLDSSNL